MFLGSYGAKSFYHLRVIEEEVWDELKWRVLPPIYSSSTLRGQGNLWIKVSTGGGYGVTRMVYGDRIGDVEVVFGW
ncbi:hypothetical protein Tco_0995463, partial [Tanacetum coccineum]